MPNNAFFTKLGIACEQRSGCSISVMEKIYLLLRNNKQTGPHTLEELVQLPLKHSDLVWVEGRSAGWQYPTEIDLLKEYVPVTGPSSVQKISESKPVLIESTTLPDKKIQNTKEKNTSEIKRIYISLPGANVLQSPVATKEKKLIEPTPAGDVNKPSNFQQSDKNSEPWEEPQLSFEERVERMRAKALTFSADEEKPKNEVDTKHSRSLDDIKAEYSGWLQEQKRGKKLPVFSKKDVLIALASFVLIAVVFITAKWVTGNDTELDKQKDGYKYSYLADSANEEKSLNDFKEHTDPVAQEKIVKHFPPIENNSTTSIKATQITKKEEQVKVSKAASDINKTHKTEALNGQKETPQDKRENTSDISQTPVTSGNRITVEKKEPPSVPLTQLISISEKEFKRDKQQSLGGYEITVQNNSNEVLNVIAVDVLYYNKYKKRVHKETLYFNNLQPHRSLTIAASGHEKAVTAGYQLGLVSSGGSLYFAQY